MLLLLTNKQKVYNRPLHSLCILLCSAAIARGFPNNKGHNCVYAVVRSCLELYNPITVPCSSHLGKV